MFAGARACRRAGKCITDGECPGDLPHKTLRQVIARLVRLGLGPPRAHEVLAAAKGLPTNRAGQLVTAADVCAPEDD